MLLRKYTTKVLKANSEFASNPNPSTKGLLKQKILSGNLPPSPLERPYENIAEKRFIQELFPEQPPLSDRIKIIFAKKASIADLNGIGTITALSAVKLQNQFAQMYAALEIGDVDIAENLFHKVWRSNRNQVKLMTSREMCNRFIEVLLERQMQEIKKGLGTFNNSWEGRANDWLSDMEKLYDIKPNLHSYCLFLCFYLQMNEIEKSKNILKKIEENFSSIISESAFSSSKLGKYLAEDSCFADNSTKLEMLNEFLVSCKHEPLSKFTDDNVGDLLLSALEETPSRKKQHIDLKEAESEPLQKVQLEATDTVGVNILLSILRSKESIAGMDKYNQQLWLESRALTAAQDQFEQEQKRMPKELRKLSRLPHDLISNWHQSLQSEIKNTMENPTKKDHSIIPFLKLVSPDIVSRIVIASVLRLPHRKNHDESTEKALTRFGQFSLVELAQLIGNSIQREHNLEQLNSKKNQKKLNLQKSIQKIHASGKLFNMAVRRAVLELKRREDAKVENWNPDWGMEVITIVGSYLLDKAIKVCVIPIQTPSDIKGELKEELVPALQHTLEWKSGKKYGVIKLHPSLYDLIANSSIYVAPWSLPMLVKPLPWLHSRAGGYLQHRFSAVRTSFNREHDEYIKAADEAEHLSTILRSLDVLGSTGWNINEKILMVAAHFWNTKEAVPGICAPIDLPEIEMPPEMKIKGVEVDVKIKKAYQKECQKREALISNAFSERCSTNYKLEIARAFVGETIYFPHNVDFRGRAYPIPPNLNHMGDDLCRGLLKFAEKRPLGERGLWWLKVHISNLYGFDKASLNERFSFTEEHLDQVLDSAQNPVEGNRWWLKADKPWQLLAACIELSEALKLNDPSSYMSNLPIHQDGSCNGLQHYAALGGDELGAAAVNLAPADRPDDIYTKIAKQVQVLVDKDAEEGVNEAVLMQKRVNRKLVKQSVMTNTYGVTFIGAREQILNRLKEARENESKETALTDEQMKACAAYSARLVFKSMDHMFEGARELQIWLNQAASLVTKSLSKEAIEHEHLKFYDELLKEGLIFEQDNNLTPGTEKDDEDYDSLMDAVAQDTQSVFKSFKKDDKEEEFEDIFEDRAHVTIKKKKPTRMTSMIWTSPLGMPIVQPYRKESLAQVKTHLQSLSILSTKTGPVNSTKQSSAFPPNFVHSLDASHMMLSSIACESQKIVFAAVHDSYWTHACDIDRMSQILRECFIRLHSQDIMGRLREELLARFSENRLVKEIELKPKDLEKVKEIAKRVGIQTRFNKRSKILIVYCPFTLPPLPKKGSFDIQQVAKSTYFFH